MFIINANSRRSPAVIWNEIILRNFAVVSQMSSSVRIQGDSNTTRVAIKVLWTTE